jgi:RNA polymerase sigma-70 factor (TIGR02957 family)
MGEWDPVVEFAAQRPRLFGVAYRLLGSASDAEDMVQDTFLRWSAADHATIEYPQAWLVKAVTNRCLDHLSSARMRRERYVGPWLPEPVSTADGTLGPLEHAQQRESVSLALLLLLEQLTPTERAVFVLREAFGYDHRSIAEILDCSQANSRQLHHRATQRIQESRPRFDPDHHEWQHLVGRFLAAARDGDLAELERMLAAGVESWADGGGNARAARRPVLGRERVGRLLLGLARKLGHIAISMREINGEPAILGHVDGHLFAVTVLRVTEGKIVALLSITNPDKLRFLERQLADLSHSEGLSRPG